MRPVWNRIQTGLLCHRGRMLKSDPGMDVSNNPIQIYLLSCHLKKCKYMKRDKAYKGKSWDVKNQLVKLIDRVIPPPFPLCTRGLCVCAFRSGNWS